MTLKHLENKVKACYLAFEAFHGLINPVYLVSSLRHAELSNSAAAHFQCPIAFLIHIQHLCFDQC